MPQVIIPGEPMRYGLRLAAYEPNGARLGVLTSHLGWEAALPLGDVPSLKLGYSGHAPGASWLAAPCEVAVEYSIGGGWIEPANARFLRIKRSGDDADAARAWSFDMPGWAWQLRKVVLYPNGAMVEGKRPFDAVSPGAILRTLVTEGQARGSVPGLAIDFTTSLDSGGQPWTATLTLALEPGTDLLAALINLSEQGVIDWEMQGRTLRVYNEGTVLGRDLASGPAPVDLRLGRDIDSAPDEATLEDASSAILIAGENGLSVEVTNPAATAPWGRWETYQSQGGVSDEGTATLLGQHALERAGREQVQLTRQLVISHASRWLPLTGYRPGDHVLAPGDQAGMQDVRIRQITLSCDGDGRLGGNLLLNDRFLERDIKLARRSAGILDGGVSTGGSGGEPSPEAEGRVPAAPVGLLADAQAYLDEHGYARGQATLTWSPVTADVNGVAVDIDGYEVYARRNEAGELWMLVAQTDASDTTATISPLVVGWTYAFKARATNNGVKGEFSAQAIEPVPDDATPPPVPTTPQLTTRLSVVHVAWDGLGASAIPMPSDVERLRIWMQDPLAPGWAEIGHLTAAGSIVVPGLPYETDREFAFTAIDRSGNESARSTTATIATAPLVDTDLIGQVINGATHIIDGSLPADAKITAGTITGALIQANAVQAAHVAANAIETDNIAAGAIQAGHLAVAAVTAGNIAANAVTADAIAATAITGKTITGSVVRSSATGQRFVLDSSTLDLRFYPAGTSNYTRMYAVDGLYPGETTTFITSGTNQFSSARAEFQVAAGLIRLRIRGASGSGDNGGVLDIAEDYGRYGFYNGGANTETYIHCQGDGRYYIRGRFWDFSFADSRDAIHAGSVTVSGGGPPNWGLLSYGPTMATNMGPVVALRDGGAGNTSGNSFTPRAWSVSYSSVTGFQVNLAANSSFALYWWAHRH
ncbi:fibronectin type III domain-containing protein [Spongiactinospora sp. TRM90649]|uniref:fibronectin type III domain-containing protein n=1 Tax=Spongiactinospora sp. TRM90649 TaxID=3031114 RepID=UPI0023F67417|nr:fibronectin type III domain-containing protein [Spongiactinospora sp. TRM90649]MDF5756669.1 fibronectin type III domain-containing protein [Spongiactinospora sp. TRM90649]